MSGGINDVKVLSRPRERQAKELRGDIGRCPRKNERRAVVHTSRSDCGDITTPLGKSTPEAEGKCLVLVEERKVAHIIS
jgi:hypothetical protein